MGNSIANGMKDNMKENQIQMIKAQKEMALRQRQIQMATQIAKGKERFTWQSAFYCIAFPGLLFRAKKTGNIAFAFPIVPMAFAWAYQYDMFYGNKMERIRKMAEQMIEEEPELFYLPQNNLLATQEEYNQIMKLQEKPKKE